MATEQLTWYKIEPQRFGDFVYFGNLIPNQLNVRTLGPTGAEFRLTSIPYSWWYFHTARVGETVVILVEFPDGKFTFYNEGPNAIEISGEFISPWLERTTAPSTTRG